VEIRILFLPLLLREVAVDLQVIEKLPVHTQAVAAVTAVAVDALVMLVVAALAVMRVTVVTALHFALAVLVLVAAEVVAVQDVAPITSDVAAA
jgi:hypothetical protein